jgi:valyl-tRNA synthetase
MVNWCPRCRTVLSDLEVEHEETQGSLWHIVYPVEGSSLKLVVATTRPETMLGDTAVAIHPKDKRAAELAGKMARLPLMDRLIPIVLDTMADPEFGSGAVKITPAHDPNDFEAGKRHNLPSVQVIGEDAKMTAAAGRFAGLDRFEARKEVLADLEKLGLLEKTEAHKLSIGKCHRCKTIVEPLVSKQWWMKMKPLAEPAIQAVEDGRITFVPANWSKTYFEWMYNIRDWCISRQLWWGHRIPAWHCGACGEVTVTRLDPSKCAHCGSEKITQDPDVLDTWFSSGLWPFATLGWPDDTPDLKAFYPTTLLVTGFDIIFFWVARMIMFGLEMMGDVPFRQVHIHGLVRDAERQKMSKTKGNTIDPLVVNEKYGTDAVRFALLVSAAPGGDIALGEERLLSTRAFANKIWNASRLLFSKPREGAGKAETLADRWIADSLNTSAGRVNAALEDHRYHEAADALWHFWWDDFCDWYLELKKLDSDWSFAYRVYETALRLLHPLMPFITEELWHRLGHEDSIALQPYPQLAAGGADAQAEAQMKLVQRVIVEIRQARADNKIDKSRALTASVRNQGEELAAMEANRAAIERLGNVTLTIERGVPAPVKLDIPVDRARLEKENEELEKQIANLERQFGNQEFMAKAPEKVIEGMRAKKAGYEAQIAKNRAAV